MEVLIEGRGIWKQYQMGEVTVNALKGVDFEVYRGEFIVVLGPSGSGKSTLLNIIGGMDSPTKGELIYDGRAISGASERELTQYRRNNVGFVFQFYNLMPNLTAGENIGLSVEIANEPLEIDYVLEKIGLSERKNHFPSQLSGGEQQRVAIGRALAKNPDLLLCDEPTGALDLSTGVEILKFLRDFNRELKKTVMIITHNAGIGKIGDRVFYIRDGMIEKIEKNEKPLRPEEVSW
ncbi:putative ABC transport system ATP-binding protein [Peptoclostridium litorale DSM 5388]|uniref:Putative ABC transporter ATP-binding protein n=1 Tax=Peptoclostridium litorale DSM 5388 TaxID=1121324 RepID=A0A069RES8_PEPLI|nr:ABC transporter ATP-binding protein [Peptoclostridium litorale]KDR94695.1 putative ABC transporter ATP-binding protein [Peptoclostridium litorale DSM 5388]SIO32732.1 putative ABC transport system ATP-binding protein [Peptoclostridium litorale DSM 5388]